VLVSEPVVASDPAMDGSIVGGYVHDGAIIVKGGNVTTPKIKLGITFSKTGTYNQTGGTVNVTTFGVGNDGTIIGGTGIGNATISGGTLNVTNLLVGTSGETGATGTFTRSAGAAVVVSLTHIGARGSVLVTPDMGTTWRTTTLLINPGGVMDLNDNKLIVTSGDVGSWNGSSYSGVTGLIQSGRGDGSWNGRGIRTSMTDATTSVLTTLAVARADETGHDGGTFGGASVSGDDVLVMYTWGGDADLNGELNGDDYFFIDSNVVANQGGANNASFHTGDFDYNGEINGDDYFILDSNILQAQASTPFPTGSGVGGLGAVPEPGSLIALGLMMGLGPLSRKRRK
jgi:hypothetical protein